MGALGENVSVPVPLVMPRYTRQETLSCSAEPSGTSENVGDAARAGIVSAAISINAAQDCRKMI